MPPKICLILTEDTIEKNLQLIEYYRPWIDAAELRADFLKSEELLHIRKFPQLARIPVILTVRRLLDGGFFRGGEGSRITLFAQGLAFADTDPAKNFAYIDLESDMHVPSLEEAAQAFNIGIIRSLHSINQPLSGIAAKVHGIRRSEEEIVKIAYKATGLRDTTVLFKEAKKCSGQNTFIAMGEYGLSSRILAPRLNSAFIYTMPEQYITEQGLEREFLDPITLHSLYRFRNINSETAIYGLAGTNTSKSLSPALHNEGFRRKGINAVYIPISAADIKEVIDFAGSAGLSGLSVTHPFKFDIIPFLDSLCAASQGCGAVNTVVYTQGRREGYNTDIDGIIRALQEFLHTKMLRFRRVAIIGTGGAAHAAAHAVYQLRGKACIFGRTAEKAEKLAKRYGFKYAVLDSSSIPLLKKYSDVMIQATSIGTREHEDPLEFYVFSGSEHVFDIIYAPEKTKMLKRAENAGCRISNGYAMLRYQAYKQFELFTGESYD
ncbi:MAG: type I 3-dehydroquinate dehydratase [Treponema sp.]